MQEVQPGPSRRMNKSSSSRRGKQGESLKTDDDEDANDEEESSEDKKRKRSQSGPSKMTAAKKDSPGVEMDISREKGRKPIPPFSCHLGDNWYVRLQDYANKRWLVLRVFDNNGHPGKGASLPLRMLPLVSEGIKKATEHVKSHSGEMMD